MKKILIIAADFPPSANPCVYRTLKLCEMLLSNGWQPIILTIKEPSSGRTDSSLEIDPGLKEWVFRSHALDAQKDLAPFGKYFKWQCIPDRWWPWIIPSLFMGKKLIKKYQPDLIWSTYPYPSCHIIARKLSNWSQLPWIADYQDPMRYLYDEQQGLGPKINLALDKKVITQCKKAVFATTEAQKLYERTYGLKFKTKFAVIENGFDEGRFLDVSKAEKAKEGPFKLLHSGGLYGGHGRDPSSLFEAIQILKTKGLLTSSNFKLMFRGEDIGPFQSKIKQLGIGDLIDFLPSVSFTESLKEMLSVDALLIFQGEIFNYQIPGKTYEYLRTGKTVLAVTPKNSATAQLLEGKSGVYISEESSGLSNIIEKIIKKEHQTKFERNIDSYSREAKTQKYIELINNVVENNE